jgi:hypothetical protein
LDEVVKMRARTAKTGIDARKAHLLADFEQQMATEYSARDERWAAAVREGKKAVARANAEIQAAFEKAGVPERFRGGLGVGWYPRGENTDPKRRAELRKVATSRLDAQAKAAKLEVDEVTVRLRSELVAGGLTSDDARRWLDELPSVEG